VAYIHDFDVTSRRTVDQDVASARNDQFVGIGYSTVPADLRELTHEINRGFKTSGEIVSRIRISLVEISEDMLNSRRGGLRIDYSH